MEKICTFSNLLSLSRIVLAPTTTLLMLSGNKYHMLAFLLFVTASITDYFDGYFARKYNEGTTLGMFLDPLADKILIISLFYAFYMLGMLQLWMIIAIALRDIAVTSLRFVAIAQGQTIATSNNAKLKTALQFIAIYFLFTVASSTSGLNPPAVGVAHHTSITYIMTTVVLLTLWTGASYIIKNRKLYGIQR